MSNELICTLVIYGWAAFWIGVTAGFSSAAPKDPLIKTFGSIFMGLFWPLTILALPYEADE